MKEVLVKDLKSLFDAVAGQMELYVPVKSGDHFVFGKYDGGNGKGVLFNAIRACTPIKEFLFPLRELAAEMPKGVEADEVKPFAVFGLKDCDLRSLEIMDKVFGEEEFEDPFYLNRRKSMFVISSDCSEAGESCLCSVFDGKPYADDGFDLNVSAVDGGFVVSAGSEKGDEFLEKHEKLFGEVTESVISERDKNRAEIGRQLEENNAELKFDTPVRDIVEGSEDSEVYDEEAASCIECQACTRICPTCHCFYLYDLKHKDYFAKMKMWDSCMRLAYAAVAGGANPKKMLGDRIKHRLMHKFVYFLDRYGIQMCIGCGRCIDAEAGGVDLREILKKLSEESKNKGKAKVGK
jgi:sulfhydrogenase subunit beta (sulfur reductase)